jgi:hypothetical protein
MGVCSTENDAAAFEITNRAGAGLCANKGMLGITSPIRSAAGILYHVKNLAILGAEFMTPAYARGAIVTTSRKTSIGSGC